MIVIVSFHNTGNIEHKTPNEDKQNKKTQQQDEQHGQHQQAVSVPRCSRSSRFLWLTQYHASSRLRRNMEIMCYIFPEYVEMDLKVTRDMLAESDKTK